MKLIIAGGGTGGHIFPGLAVGEEFLSRSPDNKVLFIGARGGLEEDLFVDQGIAARFIQSGKFSGMGLINKAKALFRVLAGVFQAGSIIREFEPDFVLGVGGYASVPVVIAAVIWKVPRAIQEQNSLPGLANRVLARMSNRVFLSFESAEEHFKRVSKGKFVVCGNPLRKKVLEDLNAAAPGNEKSGRFQIFVVGGSQGARKLNRLMLEATEHLRPLRDRLKIVHMSGSIDQYDLIVAYSKHGLRAKVSRFIDDIGRELREADLVISRAGAGAVFEIAAAGKPSILIPYPFAADDHQRVNAAYLASQKAAMVLEEKDIDAKSLAQAIIVFLQSPQKLKDMAEQAKSLARPQAAKDIVDQMIKLAGAKK